MGISIHSFVEFDRNPKDNPFGTHADVVAINSGEFYFPSEESLLKILGYPLNVEPHGSPSRSLEPRLRGLPDNSSQAVLRRFFHVVDDLGHEHPFAPSLPTVSSAIADEWITCHHVPEGPPLEVYRRERRGWENLRRGAHPAWHSPSWLSLDEIQRSINRLGFRIDHFSLTFRVVLDLMQSMGDELGRQHTRLVYWFDN